MMIKENVRVLGRIQSIHATSLSVSLAGRFFGHVYINNISKQYTEILENSVKNQTEVKCNLSDLFYESQFVIAKVIKVEVYNKSNPFTLSLSPEDVYEDFSHLWFCEKSIVSVAIKQREDHGFIVDIGLENCRCFLPFDEIDENCNFEIGQVVLARVKKCQHTQSASTLILTTKSKKVCSMSVPEYSSFACISSGMLVDFTVTRILKDGLEGVFLKDCIGYVNECHLEKPLSDKSDYQIGQTLIARVMFTLPLIKVTFCTMISLKDNPMENKMITIGSTIDSMIMKRTRNGFYLQLNEFDKGFVNFRRLDVNLFNLVNDDLTKKLSNMFTVGSRQKCRVLDYNYMERVFICTFEKKLQNTEVFSIDDLKLAQKYDAKVAKNLSTGGILVSIGRLKGLIPVFHLTDSSKLNMNKFKIGSKIKVRVLEINKDARGFVCTAKSSLVDSELPLLTSYDDIKEGLETIGFIVDILNNGLLVSFFGDVRGFISKKRLNLEQDDVLEKRYFIGQAIECIVLSADRANEYLQLTIKQKLRVNKPIEFGAFVDVTLHEKKDDGFIAYDDEGHDCFIPKYHLSRHSSLANAFMNLYEVGDKIADLCCYDQEKSMFYLSSVVKNFDNCLENNAIVQCFVSDVQNNELSVYVFQGSEKVFFKVAIKEKNPVHLEKEQMLLIRILNSEKRLASIQLPKVSTSFNMYDHGVTFLESYFEDIEKIRKLNKQLSAFHLGQQIRGTLSKLLEDGSSEIIFKNSIRGVCKQAHTTKNSKAGSEVDCVIIWIEYVTNTLIVSMKHVAKIKNIHNCNDSLEVGKYYNADIVLSTKYFSIGFLKGNVFGQIVFLLSTFSENDIIFNKFHGDKEIHVNVLLKKIADKYVICMKKSEVKIENNLVKANKRKLSEIKDNTKKINRKKRNLETEVNDNSKKIKRKKCNLETEVNDDVDNDIVINDDNDIQLVGPHDFWKVNNKFLNNNNESEIDDFDDEDNDNNKNKAKKIKLSSSQKFIQAQQEEERLRQIESEMAADKFEPQNADHFERLVLKDPDNATNWLRYMSFYLQSMEIEKSRMVGRKALTKISYRKEDEKLKIWISLLRLENSFGTRDSFFEVLNEALRCCDDFKLYSKLVKVLKHSKNSDLLEELIKRKNKLMRQSKMNV